MKGIEEHYTFLEESEAISPFCSLHVKKTIELDIDYLDNIIEEKYRKKFCERITKVKKVMSKVKLAALKFLNNHDKKNQKYFSSDFLNHEHALITLKESIHH